MTRNLLSPMPTETQTQTNEAPPVQEKPLEGSLHSACSPLASSIAHHIFAAFDECGDKCQRLAAKGGSYPYAETDLGGVCLEAFTLMIETALNKANAGDVARGANGSPSPAKEKA